jgi:DNA-binding transcriptional regulator YiaG
MSGRMSDMYLELRSRIPVVAEQTQLGEQRIQDAQDRVGLSNEAVARYIPVSEKTWRRWKKAGSIPTASLPAVARALRLDLVELSPGHAAANGGHTSGEELWQREMRDEIRTGFETIKARLDDLASLIRQLQLSVERSIKP